ncbi:MAG: hypothetical protein J5645_06620 [Lachnospiraceae bacterium]|nr:hypothetical protein [Lachnospiraceae bacterium]
MICPKCGAILNEGASRCFDCGMSFRTAESSGDMSSLKGVFDIGDDLKEKTYYRRRAAIDPLNRFKTCQILLLIGYILLIAIYLYLISMIKKAFSDYDVNLDSLESLNTVTTIIAIGIIVVGIVAIGALAKLRDCNYSFDLAFKCMIISLIVSVLSDILDNNTESTTFLLLLAIAKVVTGFLYVYFFCKGAAELCSPEAPNLSSRWELFWKISLAIDIAAIIYCIVLVVRINNISSSYTSLMDALMAALTFLQRMIIASTLVEIVVAGFMVKSIGDTVNVLETLPEPDSQQNSQFGQF